MGFLKLVQEQRDIFLKNAAKNRLPEDLERIRQAYEYAYEAHAKQLRKTGNLTSCIRLRLLAL